MTTSLYGFCPQCGAPGRMRERRLNGNDVCMNSHVYATRDALIAPPVPPVAESDDVTRAQLRTTFELMVGHLVNTVARDARAATLSPHAGSMTPDIKTAADAVVEMYTTLQGNHATLADRVGFLRATVAAYEAQIMAARELWAEFNGPTMDRIDDVMRRAIGSIRSLQRQVEVQRTEALGNPVPGDSTPIGYIAYDVRIKDDTRLSHGLFYGGAEKPTVQHYYMNGWVPVYGAPATKPARITVGEALEVLRARAVAAETQAKAADVLLMMLALPQYNQTTIGAFADMMLTTIERMREASLVVLEDGVT